MEVKTGSDLLMVDDDADIRALVVRRFASVGIRVHEAESVDMAKKMLYEVTYDLIILDLNMRPESGYTLFDFLRNDLNFKWIPLVVLSGENNVDEKVKCLNAGADDYVTKPFNFKELRARVSRLLARSGEFELMAFRDALTGVYNRRFIENHLTVEVAKVRREEELLTLVLLDIDKFKSVNDTYGHPIGDLVLQGVARLLKENLRESDLVARFGGEEFIVFLNHTSESAALNIMNKILDKIRGYSMATAGGTEVCVTFSAGIAAWEQGLVKEDWIDRADQLLYIAKQSGRNRCLTWSGRTTTNA